MNIIRDSSERDAVATDGIIRKQVTIDGRSDMSDRNDRSDQSVRCHAPIAPQASSLACIPVDL